MLRLVCLLLVLVSIGSVYAKWDLLGIKCNDEFKGGKVFNSYNLEGSYVDYDSTGRLIASLTVAKNYGLISFKCTVVSKAKSLIAGNVKNVEMSVADSDRNCGILVFGKQILKDMYFGDGNLYVMDSDFRLVNKSHARISKGFCADQTGTAKVTYIFK